MPNRILKESICVSEKINKLTWFEEVLFYRLIVKCDDFGRYDGRSSVIKGALFPLKDDITAKTIDKAIRGLVTAGLAEIYYVDAKPILQLPTWNCHQVCRAVKSKYPGPTESNLKTLASTREQMSPLNENDNVNDNVNERERAPAYACKDQPVENFALYGEHKNVKLSDIEHAALIKDFGSSLSGMIDNLSRYLKKTGKRYADHATVLRDWAREDKTPTAEETAAQKDLTERILEASRKRAREQVNSI